MHASPRPHRPLPLVAASLLLIASFAGPVLTAPALAAPCCQTCEGWPDPPVVLDSCWRWCVFCLVGESAAVQPVDLIVKAGNVQCEAVEPRQPQAIGLAVPAPEQPLIP